MLASGRNARPNLNVVPARMWPAERTHVSPSAGTLEVGDGAMPIAHGLAVADPLCLASPFRGYIRSGPIRTDSATRTRDHE